MTLTDDGTQNSIRVAADEAGDRLDRVLARHVAELSRSRLKALIEAGAVAVDGQHDPRSKPPRQFRRRDRGRRAAAGAGEARSRSRSRSASSTRTTTSSSSTSPGIWSCIPPPGHWTGTLVNALIAHCGDSLSGIGGERRPGIVHRLDKDTTGLMVVAKNDPAHRALAAQFADHGRERRAVRAQLPRLRLGRAGAPARHHRPADRPPSASARPHGGARRRPRGRHPLAGAGALWRCRPETAAGRQGREAGRAPVASLLPAGSKPAEPIRFGSIWPRSAIRSWATRSMGPDFAPNRRFCPTDAQTALGGPWQTGPACPYTVGQAPVERRNPHGSGRNCRPILPVCVMRWPAVGPSQANVRQKVTV